MSKRFIYIDMSGSMPLKDMDSLRDEMRVGDTVVSFDTNIFNVRKIGSRKDAATYPMQGSGGTLWEPVRDHIIEMIAAHGPVEALVYSDFYFASRMPTPIDGATLTFVAAVGSGEGTIKYLREQGFKVREAA